MAAYGDHGLTQARTIRSSPRSCRAIPLVVGSFAARALRRCRPSVASTDLVTSKAWRATAAPVIGEGRVAGEPLL